MVLWENVKGKKKESVELLENSAPRKKKIYFPTTMESEKKKKERERKKG